MCSAHWLCEWRSLSTTRVPTGSTAVCINERRRQFVVSSTATSSVDVDVGTPGGTDEGDEEDDEDDNEEDEAEVRLEVRCRRRRPPCSAALLPPPLLWPLWMPLRQIRRALTHLQGGPAAPGEKRRVGGRRSPQQPPFVTVPSNFVCELRCYIDREWCSGACGPSPVSSSCNMGVRASERARTPRLKLVCRCSRTSDCRPPQQQKGAGEQDITPTRLTFIAY